MAHPASLCALLFLVAGCVGPGPDSHPATGVISTTPVTLVPSPGGPSPTDGHTLGWALFGPNAMFEDYPASRFASNCSSITIPLAVGSEDDVAVHFLPVTFGSNASYNLVVGLPDGLRLVRGNTTITGPIPTNGTWLNLTVRAESPGLWPVFANASSSATPGDVRELAHICYSVSP